MEEHGKVAYDAKRDQYAGYNPEEHRKTVERFERLEAERKKHARKAKEEKRLAAEEAKVAKQEKKREQRAKAAAAAAAGSSGGDGEGVICDELSDDDKEDNKSDSNSDSGSDYDSDEEDSDEEGGGRDKEFLERDENAKDFQGRAARQGGVGGAQMKTTVRNLRIREDTPKYLYNLDLDSAHYDPKSHSMRMNPLPNENPEDLQYAGDNFVRHTGDALKLAQTQVLCWEMQARGEDIDILSSGTQAELVQKQFVEKKRVLEQKKRQELLDRYGVSEDPSLSSSSGAGAGTASTMQAYMSDPRLRLGQTETYQEYSSDGRVLKGPGAGKSGGGGRGGSLAARTKYEEDVLDQNHTQVWGSFYSIRARRWGYGCCHSTDRHCYCIGEKGKAINAREHNPLLEAKQLLEKSKDSSSGSSGSSSGSTKSGLVSRSDVYGEYDAKKGLALDESKVRAAMERIQREDELHAQGGEKEQQQEEGRGRGRDRDKKRKGYSSMSAEVEVTPEEMEAYRRVKNKREDPMAALMDSGALLEYK
jgi:pre-mRNA-processing factor SLU7